MNLSPELQAYLPPTARSIEEYPPEQQAAIRSVAWTRQLYEKGRTLDSMLASERREYDRQRKEYRSLLALALQTDSPQTAEARLLSLDLEYLT